MTSSICSGRGRTLGPRWLECGSPTEHSRQSSLWVLGPQPIAGSTGATAPSLALPTHGRTPATHCTCLSQVRNLLIQTKCFFHNCIYLFFAVLGLVAAQAFLRSRGSSLAAVHTFLICGVFSCCGVQALGCAGFGRCSTWAQYLWLPGSGALAQ